MNLKSFALRERALGLAILRAQSPATDYDREQLVAPPCKAEVDALVAKCCRRLGVTQDQDLEEVQAECWRRVYDPAVRRLKGSTSTPHHYICGIVNNIINEMRAGCRVSDPLADADLYPDVRVFTTAIEGKAMLDWLLQHPDSTVLSVVKYRFLSDLSNREVAVTMQMAPYRVTRLEQRFFREAKTRCLAAGIAQAA